ncbi:restriction endonuclease subunit S [Natronosalvus rutilus]|uniref:Restriction endonuclease subunit S n=1 Tax=Natronosalvus rutilus TaxID=2953753 RepID=A0A9E7N817_9EURY|nr:restriction endonuclease subunit S [Natronosalvus rutilus]UTF53417.1 restriction endonuclease subunit S [Natronosalvus rutilus]
MSDDQLTLEAVADDDSEGVSATANVPQAAHIEHVAFGDLPEDWTWEKSEDHLEYIRSGISKSQNKDGDGIPVSRIETIADGVVNHEKVGYIENNQTYNKDQLKPGDLLFSNINSREQIGKTAIYRGEKLLYHGMNLLRIRYTSEAFNPFFAYYVYDSPMAQDVFFRMSKAAVGQSSINQSQMERFFLPQPPLKEQREIAAVLYTVDQVIQKTEEIISGYRRVKKGLGQNLLQRGVCEHELVETDSIFGKLPKDWSLERLVDITEIVGRTEPPTGVDKYWGGDIPWATPEDIRSLDGPTIAETEQTVTQAALEEVSSNLVPPESVLLTTRATVGLCAVNEVEVTTSRAFKDLIPGERLDTWYLYYRISTMEDYLNRLGWGSTFTEVIKPVLENVTIPVPPLEEQKEIGEHLRSIDYCITENIKVQNQYRNLKEGLMQDLLAGKVRTTDTNIEVAGEIA